MKGLKIGVIGLGYVGLPLCIQFATKGCRVIGFDTDKEKVESINNGKSYIKHIPSNKIKDLAKAGNFCASNDYSKIESTDVIIICVPTPLDDHRQPDLSYVLKSGEAISPFLRSKEPSSKKLIVLESTTYPGTTENDLRMVLEKGSGLVAGKDFHLAYSPEREDPGRAGHSVQNIPKIMGGYTPACLQRCKEVYNIAVDEVYSVSSCSVAEATKLTENIFRAVNIAMVNELKVLYHRMQINVWEVIDAAATKPFGFMPFYPGPGLGGHCIPIDPFYLTWKAREYEQNTRFIELAGEINTAMPEYVISVVTEALNEESKSLKGSSILLLGLAYKPDVDDARESPSLRLINKLEQKGAFVYYNDPHISIIGKHREFPELEGRISVDISDNHDVILVATHHTDYKKFDFSNFDIPVVDTRNCIEKRPKKYYYA